MLILEQEILDYTSININVRYLNWDSATSYSFGEVSFYGQYYYRSIVDNNLNVLPTDDTAKWLRWDISNRYAAIDLQAATTTVCDVDTITGGVAPFDLVMEFDNNRYDTLALGDVYGSNIKIEVFKDPDSTTPYQVITKDISTIRSCVDSWYNYYYCPLASELDDPINSMYFRLYPVRGKIRVTITQGSLPKSSVAYMIGGRSDFIGDTLFNVGLGIVDYSKKEFDDFGILELTRRESRQTRDVDVSFDSARVTEVNRIVRANLGKVVLFINDESQDSAYDNLLLLGLLQDFTTVLSNPIKTQASFSLEEVI